MIYSLVPHDFYRHKRITMNRNDLENRTKKFHVDVIRLCESLPRTTAGFEIGRQIIRSAGSVGANYRATRRAKSKPDFIYKIEIVIEEADETLYWLEVIKDTGLISCNTETERLLAEANEMTTIFTATVKTLKQKKQQD